MTAVTTRATDLLRIADLSAVELTALIDLTDYQVNAELMAHAAPDAIFLHCLPAHRGEEVASAVIDGPQSAVFQQAANRLPTEQAALYSPVTGDWEV